MPMVPSSSRSLACCSSADHATCGRAAAGDDRCPTRRSPKLAAIATIALMTATRPSSPPDCWAAIAAALMTPTSPQSSRAPISLDWPAISAVQATAQLWWASVAALLASETISVQPTSHTENLNTDCSFASSTKVGWVSSPRPTAITISPPPIHSHNECVL